ncbi:mechanosensitive ion channel family protein [Micromonospora sp. MS34]|uniref:mechanosensitive ion channel family protein n=1 Tax=Micromonospora sp. MS34 TaxID=3385971 RepID=UPI0039A21C5D
MRDNFGNAVGDAFRSVMLFLPKAVAFIAILVVGWLIAKAVLKLVDALLERVHFDKAVERGGIKTALARSKYDASDLVAKLAYYAVLLVTLQLAFGIWGPNPISDLIAGVIAWLPRAFVAIVIVVVAAAIARAVKDIISGALGGLSYGRVLANIASVFILGLGIIAALNQIGVATAVTTPVLIAFLATVGGILVVGVGGGLVRPMQSRWENWLTRAEEESRTIATHARAYQAGRRDVEERLSPANPYAEAELTQPVARDAEAELTQPIARDTEADRTQPVAPYASAEPAASPYADSERTQPTTPRQPAAEQAADGDATMVIPQADVEKFRR